MIQIKYVQNCLFLHLVIYFRKKFSFSTAFFTIFLFFIIFNIQTQFKNITENTSYIIRPNSMSAMENRIWIDLTIKYKRHIT